MTDQITLTLNIWASKVHHEAQGGSGYPDFDSIFREPAPVVAIPPGDKRVFDSSGSNYDASPKKYESRPKWSDAVLSRWEIVENALINAPDWLRVYLLFQYPTGGLYGPSRGQETGNGKGYHWSGLDKDDPVRSFVETFGEEYFFTFGKASRNAAIELVRLGHREVCNRVRQLLK